MRRAAMQAGLAMGAVGAAAMVLLGCVTTEQLAPPVDAAMIDLASRDGWSPEALDRGRRVYLSKCTHCHSPERISDYSKARWTEILGTMSHRSGLTDRESADVRAYVLAARGLADADAAPPID